MSEYLQLISSAIIFITLIINLITIRSLSKDIERLKEKGNKK